MNVADTSVVIAGFASWHEVHEPARAALDDAPRLVAHAALETYSVLTRLPPPHRAPPDLVVEFLLERFPEPWLLLPWRRHVSLLRELPRLGITGGATYDAAIAVAASDAGATLLTCDRRAVTTYERLGASVRIVG